MNKRNFYKRQLRNPEVVHHIVNEYCKGKSLRDIKNSLYQIYSININRDTVRYWINYCKRVFDIDSLREKEYLSFNQACNISSKFVNGEDKKIKHNRHYCEKMKLRIISMNKQIN